jgi:hypothetical protein
MARVFMILFRSCSQIFGQSQIKRATGFSYPYQCVRHKSMELQHEFIKALQHTHIMKIPRRQARMRMFGNRDIRLSNTVHGYSRTGDHTV